MAQLKNYTFEEAESLSKQHPKPLLIFIHTSWCNYCRLMENSTFKDSTVVKLLNENYYYISLDAEHKAAIIFNKQTYSYQPYGPTTGVHQLALTLGTINKQLRYPSLLILGNDYSIRYRNASYLTAKELVPILDQLK